MPLCEECEQHSPHPNCASVDNYMPKLAEGGGDNTVHCILGLLLCALLLLPVLLLAA